VKIARDTDVFNRLAVQLRDYSRGLLSAVHFDDTFASAPANHLTARVLARRLRALRTARTFASGVAS